MDYLTDWAINLEIASCCRDPDRRVIGQWQQGQPARWFPGTVNRPDGTGPLSDNDAWELIADLIEARHALKIVSLDKPPGSAAYVLLAQIPPDGRHLYAKIVLTKSGRVIGRSFHYSDY
ncbi:MAG TPA: hypothetical protein VHT03_02480 [Rhizomicrobium sp.]|jgi:hypothetical protein|nr:hypothetical protein [Rhizomicrobium sp.]